MTVAELITINVGVVTVVLGLLKGWKDFLNKEIEVEKNKAQAAVMNSELAKSVTQLQSDHKFLMEWTRTGETRLKTLENGYVDALRELVAKNPYGRRRPARGDDDNFDNDNN